MKSAMLDLDTFCDLCGKNHHQDRIRTFEGAYGIYCVPLKKLNVFKTRLKNSKRFRAYLSIEQAPEELIYDTDAWKRGHRFQDVDFNQTCVHAISGGCRVCYPPK